MEPTRPQATGQATSKAAMFQLQEHLQAELAAWRALHRKFEPVQVWLEGRIAFSRDPQKTDLEKRKAELDRKLAEAEQRIAEVGADLAALLGSQPGRHSRQQRRAGADHRVLHPEC